MVIAVRAEGRAHSRELPLARSSVREGKANENEEEHGGDMETFEVVEVEIIEAVLN